MIHKLMLIATILLVTACAGTGEGNSTATGSTGSSGTLRVGINPDYPPIAYKDHGKLTGIEVVLARQTGVDLNKEIEFVELPWDDLIPALDSGKIDVIMSGMSITSERAQRVRFTDPYMSVGQMAIIRKENISKVSSPLALYKTRLRVGYAEGTTGELFVNQNLVNAVKVPLESGEAGIPALRAGKIDIFIHDAPTAWELANNPEETGLMALYWPLTEEELAWAVRKNDLLLRNDLNDMIAGWKKSGRLQATLNQWIRVRVEVR